MLIFRKSSEMRLYSG